MPTPEGQLTTSQLWSEPAVEVVEEVKVEEVSTEVVAEKKAKPRRRRKPKAKPENGDQA